MAILALMLNKGLIVQSLQTYCFNKLSQGKGQSVGDTCVQVRLLAFPYLFTTKTKQMKTNYVKVCSAKNGRVTRSNQKPISTHQRTIIALTELGEDVKQYRREAATRMYNRLMANQYLNPLNSNQ